MRSYRRIRNIKLVEKDWLIKGRTQQTVDRIKAPTIADMSIDFRFDPPSREKLVLTAINYGRRSELRETINDRNNNYVVCTPVSLRQY